MLCDQVREHLSAYLDRELTADLSAAVRAHLDACAECRDLAADLRATADLLGRLPARPAPGHLADDVMREIERRGILAIGAPAEPELQERTLPMRRPRFWPRALAVAAMLVMALGIGILAYLGRPGQQTPSAPGLEVAMNRTDSLKVLDERKSLGSLSVAMGEKQAERFDDFTTQQPAPAAAPAERPPAQLDTDAVALVRKMPQGAAKKTLSLEIDGDGAVGVSNLKALEALGDQHGCPLVVAGKAPAQAVTLAQTAWPKVVLTAVDKDAGISGNGGLVGRTWDFNGDVGQVTITLNGAPAVGGAAGAMLVSVPAGTFWGSTVANGGTVTLGSGTAPGYGLVTTQPLAEVAPLKLDLIGVTTAGVHFAATPAASDQTGYGGRASSQYGAVSLAAAPAKAELQQERVNTYSRATIIAGGTLAESPAARPPAANAEIESPVTPQSRAPFVAEGGTAGLSGRVSGTAPRPDKPAVPHLLGGEAPVTEALPLAAGVGSPVAGKAAAAKARGMAENAPAALEQTMLAAAAGEAGVGRLSRAATGDAIRAADNQLVIRAESPDAADRSLVELFKAAGWRPLAVDRASSFADEERENRLGAGDYAYGPAATEHFTRAIPPGGVYYRATRDGEDVWLVLADRDSISRFGSRLAQAQELTVAAESSTDFRAIRGLQEQLRRQSELARTEESVRRSSGGKDFGGAELAKADRTPAPAMKPSAGQPVAAGFPATAASPATAAPVRDEKQSKKDLGALQEGVKRAESMPSTASTASTAPAVAAAIAPAAAPVAAAAEAKTQEFGEAAGTAAAAAAKPAPAEMPTAGLPSQGGGRGMAGGESGGGGGAALKGVAVRSKEKAEEKPQPQLEAEYAKAPPAPQPGAAPADRILLVIRVQPVLASRTEADKAAPAATQPAQKPAP